MSVAELAARWSAALAGWIPAMSLATGALLLAAFAADRLLERRVSAAVRLWLYAAVLLRLVLPAAWHSPLGLLGSRAPAPLPPGDLEVTMAFTPLAPAAPSWGAGWLALAYGTVAVALLARWLHARLAMRRRLAEAVPLDLFVDVRVLRHPRLGPLVTGLFRPCIVVPAWLADAPDGAALGWVLRHERAHVHRRDLLVGALAQLLCLVAWPILPAWIAARQMRALMELACDEAAVRDADGADRRRYGEVLLALAEPSRARTLAPALSFGWALKGRLRALALRRRWPALAQAAAVASVAVLALACAGEPPPLDDGATVADVDALADVGRSTRLDQPARARPTAARTATVAADGRFAPFIHIDHSGAIWLHTRRLGSVRVGDAEPLERSLREALAETGSRTVLIEVAPSASPAMVARVREAARRAGATDQAVTVMAAPDLGPHRGSDPQPARRRPNDPLVTVTRGGQLYLGPEHIAPQDLEAALRRALERSTRRIVLFQLDSAVDRASVGDLLTVARQAGAQDAAVLSEPSGAAPPAEKPFKQGIKETIEAHSGEIRSCYEQHLRQSRSDGGKLVFRWKIAPTGEVSQVTWEGPELGDLGPCIREVLGRVRFAPLEGIKGPLLVAYPFYFQAGR